MSYSTIVELLKFRALQQQKQTGFSWLEEGETVELCWTYQDLEQRAKTIASSLQSLNAKGSRALLLYPPGLEFIAAFFGCLYAGVIAVPAYPPRPNQSILRLQSIAKDSQASFVLSTSSLKSNIKEQLTKCLELPIEAFVATDELDISLASEWQELVLNNEYLAFLQYTSGSTGKPKGVIVNHGNLLHNLEQISQSFELNASTSGVFWLPFYHDMGLIGGILLPLYRGFHSVLMSPISFLQSPLRWLQAISRYKVALSGGPNFAYDFCANKITPEQRVALDLSSWNIAFTGAEPIRAETLEKFATAFADCGFRRESFYPCYGMAEGTLFITGGIKANAPVIKTVDAEALTKNHIVSITTRQENFRQLIGCGHAWLNQKLVIVNPENLISCPDGQVGEIWVSGKSIAQGYWNAPEQTEKTFQAFLADTGEGPFLRTGDLGFVQDGELFVTGRLKDLIIIRGRNYYPQDIELTVEQSSPSVLRLNCSATFSIEIDGEERLVLVAEVERRYWQRRSSKRETNEGIGQEKQQSDRRREEAILGGTSEVSLPSDTEATIKSIRQKVAEEHQLQAYAIVLIKPGSIPKTSSGKIQRSACREAFLGGTLAVMASSILGPMPQSSVAQTTESDAAARSYSSPRLLVELDLCNEIGRILGISSDQLTAQDVLNSLGLDSLKVVEIKNYLETKYGLSLPIEIFLQPIAISQIASWILSETESPATIAASTPKVAIETLIKSVEDIKPLDDAARGKKPVVKAGIEFSLFYFSSNEAESTDNKYSLLIEGAKFADRHNFTAVWVPERHFHAFGAIYPNPSVLAAALAMVTKRVRLRAGSVVLPMHNPVRVAEEWSVIDNLSDGRVDMGFAAGWNPNDFVLAPENYANRTEILFRSMQTVKKLWRGESVSLPNGVGEQANIRIYPLPRQSELPIWTTCTGGKERFMEAGAAGTNILTALLFQSIEELAEKVSIYREARYKNGHDPDSGHVTLMLHTFIGEDIETIRAKVKEPFIQYLKSSVNLWRQNAESLQDLNEKEQQELLNYAFERYFQASALFGTPTSCLAKIERLKEIGINEIACLIDFGVDTDSVMASLYSLKKLKNLANEKSQIQKKLQPSFTVSHHYDVISQNPTLDLNLEAVLDEAIHPGTTNTAITEYPTHIFLTGATGFLGAFLLYELLQQTSASIHCLVRANSPEIGKERIQANLEKYSLWNLDFKDRIVAVIGDISKPLLGLNSEQFENLAQQIDWIYHNAALLNFIYPYSALKSANVLGTQEVLRLACQAKVKPVHYISTTAVFDSVDYTGKVVTENEELVNPNGILVGYAQSKWVAEKLVTIARERGLPVTIYRPAWILGHTQTGICNTSDFICRFIKGCIQMGSMPDLDYVWNISPVDYVSRATIYLSKQAVIGKAFHLISPHPLYWNELVNCIGSFGYPVKHIPYQEWQSKLRSVQPSEDNPLYPLVPLFFENRFKYELTIPQLYQQGRMPELDFQETLKSLREAGLVCPPVDKILLKTYFTYFTDSGFLPSPVKVSAELASKVEL